MHALIPALWLVAASVPAGAEPLRLSVDDAVRLALERGEQAEVARQDVRITDAQKGVALANALPKVDLNAVYNRNLKRPVLFFPDEDGNIQSIELGEDNEYRATLSLRQPLFSSGRVGAAYSAAKQRAEAARHSGRAAASDIALQVRGAYYGALLARDRVTLAARSLDQAERNRDQVRARVEQGVLPRFDLLRAEVEVANRRPGLTRARNAELLAGEELRRVLALPLDAPLVLTDTLGFEPFPFTREVVVEEALDTRPDLAAARTEARAARAFLRAQAHNDLPLLYLDGNYTWQGQTSNGMIPGDNESAQSAALGLTLTWPILDGWDNRARTRQAESRAVQAELAASGLERTVRVESRAAWADVRSIAEELEGTGESILLAREALSIAEVRYDNGLSTQLELLDADLALYQAELTRLETLYRYNVALAALDHAVGRGPALDPDEEAP